MSVIQSLEWRYATKAFDPSRKIDPRSLELLKEAIRLSPTSYGLQLFKVIIIEDIDLKNKLLAHTWNQKQIVQAPLLFVFCNYTNPDEKLVDEYMELKSAVQKIPLQSLHEYAEFVKKSITAVTPEKFQSWTAKQCYIALANLMVTCGELRIDCCPLEGFKAPEYNEILGLDEKNLNAAVLAAVGYRAKDDKTQHLPKVRKPMEMIFETIV